MNPVRHLNVVGASLSLLLAAAPLTAHHAATMFDSSRLITIKGTIKTFEWTNPHVWIWVSVPGANGEMKSWGIETANLSMARRMGMSKDTFKPGEKVTMVINPMKDGREGGRFRRATFEDGHVIDMSPPSEQAAAAAAAAPPPPPPEK
jgi:hypothetical protein